MIGYELSDLLFATLCEVVRLMQWREGSVLLETRDHALVDGHRPVIFRPAMDDPVDNRDKVEALGLPEPSCHHGNRRGNVGDLVRRIGSGEFMDRFECSSPNA